MKLLHTPNSTLARLAVGGLVLSAGIGGPTLLVAGAAQAAACGTATPAGTDCTMTGTLALTAGTMTLTSPSSLGWGGTVNGLDQRLVDPTAADQTYLVNDSTGSGPGWHVTVSATTFTSGAKTLADVGTFSTDGSKTSILGTAGPTAACAAQSTCTLPTDTTTYPVAITTAASAPTAVNIYSASAATGLGSIVIGGSTAANPVGWWLNVPGNTQAGTYTSTVSMEMISAP
jgi:WxL domain surface cell wall-binding